MRRATVSSRGPPAPDQAYAVKADTIADRGSLAALAACGDRHGLRAAKPMSPDMSPDMSPHLPSVPDSHRPLTLVGAELQRQEEGLRLLRQLKDELGQLIASLHAVLEGQAEAAPSLRPATAAIYTTLLGLASLRPPQPDKAHDAVYEIGTAVKSLDLKHLDDPHATADALTRIEGAVDRIDALATGFWSDGRDNAAPNPLSKAVGALL